MGLGNAEVFIKKARVVYLSDDSRSFDMVATLLMAFGLAKKRLDCLFRQSVRLLTLL